MMWASMGVNVLLAGLLLATIFYCYVLDRRIRVLQDSRSDLSRLLKRFDESTRTATEHMHGFQQAVRSSADTLQTRIDRAHFVHEDLAFLVEKASALADKLEASLNINRQRVKVERQMGLEKEKTVAVEEPSAPVEKVAPKASATQYAEQATASISALQEMLQRISVNTARGAEKPTRAGKNKSVQRTRLEKELIEMLKEAK